jgi:mono/diheme cytochrome c family protein
VAWHGGFILFGAGRLSCSNVTEIPEHLLKRSQSAKAKATGAPAPADAPPAPSTGVAKAEAAAPAVPAKAAKAAAPVAPVVKPDPPYVAAAKARRKIPFWAMATLSILPLWVFMYARSLTPVPEKVKGPLADGATLYKAGCSSCHGGGGEGGVGYQFSGGEILKTFPHIEDQLRWVYAGTTGYTGAGVTVYGTPERTPIHNTGVKGVMPAQGSKFGGSLTEVQILDVVCHERYTLGGADLKGDYAAEYAKWCAADAPAYAGLKDGSLTFDNISKTLTGTFTVGTVPAAGHKASDKP